MLNSVESPIEVARVELVPKERLVYTEVYEAIPDGEDAPALNTLTFTERDGRTTLTILVQHTSQEHRDTSTPAWKLACRTGWTCSSRWRFRSSKQRPARSYDASRSTR